MVLDPLRLNKSSNAFVAKCRGAPQLHHCENGEPPWLLARIRGGQQCPTAGACSKMESNGGDDCERAGMPFGRYLAVQYPSGADDWPSLHSEIDSDNKILSILGKTLPTAVFPHFDHPGMFSVTPMKAETRATLMRAAVRGTMQWSRVVAQLNEEFDERELSIADWHAGVK